MKSKAKPWITSLFKFQIAGFLATVIDFSTLIILTDYAHIYYVLSTAIAAFCGAVANFLICKYWAFVGSSNNITSQIYRYFLVSSGSMVLNTLFVYLLTEFGDFNYKISKVITAIIIASTYNFLLQKLYVFKK